MSVCMVVAKMYTMASTEPMLTSPRIHNIVHMSYVPCAIVSFPVASAPVQRVPIQ